MSVYLGHTCVDMVNTSSDSTSKPYDSKIEYLESDGVAYIDTEVIPSAGTTVETWVQMAQTTSDSWPAVCGSRSTVGSSTNIQRYTIRFDQNTTSSGHVGNTFQKSPNPTTTHNYGEGPYQLDALSKVKMCMNANGCYYELNNSITQTSLPMTSSEPFNISLYLYTVHCSDGIVYSGDAGKYVRIYSFFMKEGDTVLDLIPVRVGTVGYMYDKVSGKLFGNANTEGAFVLGPDVE